MINLAAIREANDEERERTVEIALLCQEAGKASLTADYIAKGLSVRQVRSELTKPALAPKARPQQPGAFSSTLNLALDPVAPERIKDELARRATAEAAAQKQLFRPMSGPAPLAGSGFDLAAVEAATGGWRNAAVQ
jgi:hypothetical protein